MKKIKDLLVRPMQILRGLDTIIYYCINCIRYPMNERQILMLSDSREDLSGNLWFIDQAIDKEKYEVKYCFHARISGKRSKKEKKELCKMLATSRWILVDDFIPVMYPIPIRKGSQFIQVWHAMGAFKTVGFSRMGKPGGPSKWSLTHRNYTGAIVSSEQIRENYAEAFGISKDKVHAIGIPRTDVFFDPEYREEIRARLYEKYPQLKGKKVVLFAPTFRGNGKKTAHYPYEWIDFDKVRDQLGEDCVFLIKMHPFIQNRPEQDLSDEFYLDITGEREINDFLFVTDVLITDYSSVIFEASLLNIQTIFFVPDLKEYMMSRDFYYPYNEYTYGPVVEDVDALLEAVKHNDMDETKLKAFKEKFCSSCDGKASKRFVKVFLDE